jgi:hypothetical protein
MHVRMEDGQVGGNGKLDRGGGNAGPSDMPRLDAVALFKRLTPEERSLQGRRGARARWKRRDFRQSKRLRQIMESAAKAYVEGVRELARNPTPSAVVLGRVLRRLLASFSNLYLFHGGDLPIEAQRLLALTVDELQRQEREEPSGGGDVT